MCGLIRIAKCLQDVLQSNKILTAKCLSQKWDSEKTGNRSKDGKTQGFEVCLKKKKINSHLEAVSRKGKEERPKPRKKAYA